MANESWIIDGQVVEKIKSTTKSGNIMPIALSFAAYRLTTDAWENIGKKCYR
jgi:hypothetical protein